MVELTIAGMDNLSLSAFWLYATGLGSVLETLIRLVIPIWPSALHPNAEDNVGKSYVLLVLD